MAGKTLREVLSGVYPESVFAAWEADGFTTLLPIQELAVASGILDGRSCLVVGPTSSGKTFVGELVCLRQATNRCRSICVVPYKAIAEERAVEFNRRYAARELGANVVVSTGERRDRDRQVGNGDFDVALLTYEKLSTLLVSYPSIFVGAGALIVDEIQMVSDRNRGADLELLLTRARQVAPGLQLVGLSASVAGLNGFDQWLGAVVVRDDHRPVALREGIVDVSGAFDYLEWSSSERKKGTEKLSALTGDDRDALVASSVSSFLNSGDQQVLTFVTTVARTSEMAYRIANKNKHLPAAKKTKERIADLEETESVLGLLKTLDHGVGFHSADLTFDERLAVEDGFRDGEVRCLVSTTTLAMGVNLPASTVVIADDYRFTFEPGVGRRTEPIEVGLYRNMSGRAGRFGRRSDPFGRSVLVAETDLRKVSLRKMYLEGQVEDITSRVSDNGLESHVLSILASRLCDTPDGVRRFLLRTFGARLQWPTEETRADLAERVAAIVESLTKNDLARVGKSGKLETTRLGLVCAASGLRLDTFAEVAKLAGSGNTSSADLALVAALSKDAGPSTLGVRLSTPEFRERTPFFVRQLWEHCVTEPSPRTEALLQEDASIRHVYDVAKAVKFQVAALAFVSAQTSRSIEARVGISAGRVRGVGAQVAWLGNTAASIAWGLGNDNAAKAYERLAERFLLGCTDAALPLAALPHGLPRSDVEAIARAGYTSPQAILDVDAVTIAGAADVAKARVVKLQDTIRGLLGEAIGLERDQSRRLRESGAVSRAVENLYLAKGTLLEQAIETVLVPPFCELGVNRIAAQRQGEADLRIVLSNGRNGIAQVTAKDRATDKIGMTKAGSVLQQSPELSPEVFICFGRPEFDKTAIKKAESHAETGRNYKLIPVATLAEMYVRFHEGKLSADRVRAILEEETGHITIARL